MASALGSFRLVLRRLRTRVLRHRRLLAALAVGLATWTTIQAVTAPAASMVAVWTAGRDLPSGAVLARGDLERVEFLPHSVPAAPVTDIREILGRTLAHPIDAGQPMARSMVVSERWSRRHEGTVVGVRIGDPSMVGLLRVGDRVDLYAVDVAGGSEAGGAALLADAARVVAMPSGEDDNPQGELPGRLARLAVDDSRVQTVTAAAAGQFLSVAWSG